MYHSLCLYQAEKNFAIESQRLNNRIKIVKAFIPRLSDLTEQSVKTIIDRSKQLPIDSNIEQLISAGPYAEYSCYPKDTPVKTNPEYRQNFEMHLTEFSRLIAGMTNSFNAYKLLNEQKNAIPDGIPVKGILISGFGFRESPFDGRTQLHRGIDIIAKFNTPIMSTGNGTVVSAGTSPLWGKNVLIDHGFGIRTQYGHLNSINVRKGQQVQKGDIIGRLGQTGRATGPHIHYQIWIGDTPKDPLLFISKENMSHLTNLWTSSNNKLPKNAAMGDGGR